MPASAHSTGPVLAGRVAVVTGGASGLGGAVASLLADAGAQVIALDHSASAIEALPARAGLHGQVADVGDDASVAEAFERIAAAHGAVSILVNCAGIADPGSVVRREGPMPLSEFKRVLEVNLIGTLNCIRHAVPQMINARRGDSEAGVIINTASIAAFEGQMGQAAYAASKGAVAGMVLPLARELGEHGIRVMGIAPGVFETPMTLNLPQKSREVVFAARPPYPPRAGKPEEFAALALSILTNPMLNGDVIRLDGGLRMPARL